MRKEAATAFAHLDEGVSIARESGDQWALAYTLYWAYCIPREDLEKDFLDRSIEEAVSLARRAGDPYLLALTINGMADRIQWEKNDETQIPYLLESLKLAREIDDHILIGYNIRELGLCHVELGEYRQAAACYRELLQRSMKYHNRRNVYIFIRLIGRLAVKKGHAKRGVCLIAASEEQLTADPAKALTPDPELFEELGLDEASIKAEWAQGRELSLEKAVALAFEELDS